MKSFMVSRATSAISNLVQAAVKSSEIFQNVTEPLESPETTSNEFSEIMAGLEDANKMAKLSADSGGYTEVDLGDGTKARLKA